MLVSQVIGLVASLWEETIILERGRINESGGNRDILATPRHVHAQKLLSSIPSMRA